MSTSSSNEVTGKIYYDPQPTDKAVHGEIDAFIDKAENFSRETSKTAATGLIPLAFTVISKVLKLFGVPESASQPIGAYCLKKSTDTIDPSADYCAKSTSKVAKTSLYKCGDSATSWYNYFTSRSNK